MSLDAETQKLLEEVRASPDDDTLLSRARTHLTALGNKHALSQLLQECASHTRAAERAAALFIEAGGLLKDSRAPLADILATYARVEDLRVGDRWRALSLHAQAAAISELGGDRAHAISLLEKALIYDPSLDHSTALIAQLLETDRDPRARTRAANLYTRLGERGGGLPYFRRALSIHPTCELALAHLEVALLRQGSGDQLVPYWERFVRALDRRQGTASARAEAHVRCQLAAHLSRKGLPDEARALLYPVRDAHSPSVLALLEELDGQREGDISKVEFLDALEDVENSEITSEDVAVRLSDPPVWGPPPSQPSPITEGDNEDEDFPRTAPAANPMHVPRGLEAETTHLRDDSAAQNRSSAPGRSRRRRSKPSYTGWAPPDGSEPIIEDDPDDLVVMDERAMKRLFPSDELGKRANLGEAQDGHAVEVVHFRHETVLSVEMVHERFSHRKISVLFTSKGAKVSFPRGYTSASHNHLGRTHLLAPGLTDVEVELGGRLDALIGSSRFVVSVRPRSAPPSGPVDIRWKSHGLSLVGSLSLHVASLFGLASVVTLGSAPMIVETRLAEPSRTVRSPEPPTIDDKAPTPPEDRTPRKTPTIRTKKPTTQTDEMSNSDRARARGQVLLNPALLKVRGSLHRRQIMAVLKASKGKIQSCYDEGLARKRALRGRVQVKWSINIGGRARSVRLGPGTLADRQVQECVLAVVRKMRFPRPSRRPVAVSHSFVFKQGP